MIKKLLNKIKNKKIKIGIVGLGYVGLPLASGFLEKGIMTYGFDKDKKKINFLKKGKSYINYFSSKKIQSMVKKGLFPTRDFSYISNVDVIILCLSIFIKGSEIGFDPVAIMHLSKYTGLS